MSSHTASVGGRTTPTMIRLAPSPRDPIKLSSPRSSSRSFRSSAESRTVSPRRLPSTTSNGSNFNKQQMLLMQNHSHNNSSRGTTTGGGGIGMDSSEPTMSTWKEMSNNDALFDLSPEISKADNHAQVSNRKNGFAMSPRQKQHQHASNSGGSGASSLKQQFTHQSVNTSPATNNLASSSAAVDDINKNYSPNSQNGATGGTGGTGGGGARPQTPRSTRSSSSTPVALPYQRPLAPTISAPTKPSQAQPSSLPSNNTPVANTTPANTAPTTSSTKNSKTSRSKKMLVIDPKSGHKVHLHEDDHSLTDKELHVYHKRRSGGGGAKGKNHSTTRSGGGKAVTKGSGKAAVVGSTFNEVPGATHRSSSHGSSNNSNNSNNNGSNANVDNNISQCNGNDNNGAARSTHQTPHANQTDEITLNTDLQSYGETLETASALTEVSYYGRYKLQSGPFQCVIPTSCRSVENMTFGDYLQFGHGAAEEGEEDDDGEGGGVMMMMNGCKIAPVERRDDVEIVERGRYKHLLEDDNAGADGLKNKGVKYTKYDDEGNSFNSKIDENNNGDDQEAHHPTPPALLSPMTALGNLVSPRVSSLAKSFFDNNASFDADGGGADVINSNSPAGAVEIKFRRICLVVFPEEVRRCLEGPDVDNLAAGTTGNNDGKAQKKRNTRRMVGLLGMKFEQNGNDFQAHVDYVQRGSKADRLGVRKGDIVSFAVALSNMTEEQNSFLAEKLIKRLESVGMRTSYRELYDIFLSKTTNERPIGLVFRRWKNKGNITSGGGGGVSRKNGGNGIVPSMNIRITDEFEWSTDFLQSLSIKCREYEFDRKVPLIGTEEYTKEELETEEDLPLLSFLPRPNVDTSPKNGLVADYLANMLENLTLQYNCGASDSIVPACMESTLGVSKLNKNGTMSSTTSKKEASAGDDDFLSNRVLCSLVEQSMGLIFLRRTMRGREGKASSSSAQLGSGFAVVRKAEGSWSAPCFLSVLGSKDLSENDADNESSFTYSYSTASTDDVKMVVIRKKELVNSLILGNTVKFSVRKDERANVLVRDAAIIGVREGRFQLASDFYLAVKVNDVQNQGAYSLSTDHVEASDILIGTISPPEQSVDFYGALQSLELPYSMHSHPVIPDMLQKYSDSDWVEFLPDQSSTTSSCGMRAKLQMISKSHSLETKREIDIFSRKFKYYLMDGVPVHRVLSNNNGATTEEKVLRLTIKDPHSLFRSSLELTRKRRPGVSNVGIPSNFSTTFENVTKLSRTPPVTMLGNYELDEDEKKRFFSIETDLSPGPIMMLAKSKKDAMILLCGLKLLLEREKMLS